MNEVFKNGPYVLCQDCLKQEDYTHEKHREEVMCSCGGAFCGCYDCNKTLELLRAGETRKSVLGTKRDITNWTPEGKKS
ncbi:hypothetical protein [Vibrio europaeus]|uniref:Uncharacterized protein n=1 Tax=Vibrio europaeus TaxID=300876 RepID=A0ABT5GNE4_9VIBR|nr:hypothetical protein [Vibrio europaeus]MDC5723074.1 hypothetical protein [Vibrio europaeus]MDC5728031.1 hypothetical protein [Vibrio europaeus]MDC5733334.1 hypothetical protein [Vibrio europaeus]MDC5738627.1 hypothetical protein [Vibrio europaeus]MDC5743811.1 hypothetical protein [Vibrio europaeus]